MTIGGGKRWKGTETRKSPLGKPHEQQLEAGAHSTAAGNELHVVGQTAERLALVGPNNGFSCKYGGGHASK